MDAPGDSHSVDVHIAELLDGLEQVARFSALCHHLAADAVADQASALQSAALRMMRDTLGGWRPPCDAG